MKLRTAVVLALLPVTVLGACKKRPQVTPEPTPPPSGMDAGAAAREDSIRLANEREANARLERERMERERLMRETAAAREVLEEIVFFEYDSDEITGRAEDLLRMKAAVLEANPSVRMRIEGHADQRGSTEYNLALGQRRAEAVRAFLANYGVDPDRFATTSYGKERPLVDGDGEAAWSRNRRAEFAITGGEVRTVPAGIR